MINPELKALRMKYNLTQERAGELMGVNRITYNLYENGKATPTKDKIDLLMYRLKDSMVELAKESLASYMYDFITELADSNCGCEMSGICCVCRAREIQEEVKEKAAELLND